MKRYIFEERNGIYIIDLAKTVRQVRVALEVVSKAVENHQRILFVGTKKQAKAVIRECGELCGEFYVSERWLGGMLTNLMTIRQSVKTLERIEKKLAAGGEGLTKKETTLLNKEREKLDRNLSGIRGMRKPPGLLIVVDPNKERIAVAEANKLGIQVIGLVDTNCDPDPVDHIIPCNDDALKSIKLITKTLANEACERKRQLNIVHEREEGAKREKLPPLEEAATEAKEEEETT